MGFSTIAATAIISVALVMSMEYITGDVIPVVEDANDSFRDMKNRAIDQVQTDVNISELVTFTGAVGTHDLNVTINNTGSVTLNTTAFTILVDGISLDFTTHDSNIYPMHKTNFSLIGVVGEEGSGDHLVKIISENGITDYRDYSI